MAEPTEATEVEPDAEDVMTAAVRLDPVWQERLTKVRTGGKRILASLRKRLRADR